MELLLGCGRDRAKRIVWPHGSERKWNGLVTLDYERSHDPDVCWNMHSLPLPFPADHFDEMHAYEVLEHVGQQGDWQFFFAQWSDFWRMLKPGGLFIGTVPLRESPWAWGDPSHTRIIPPESFVFLSQAEYTKQIGKTPMSDFRSVYKADFDTLALQPVGHSLAFVLRAVKPSRISI